MDGSGNPLVALNEIPATRIPTGGTGPPVREAPDRRPSESFPEQLRAPEKLEGSDLQKLTEALNRMSDVFRTEVRFTLHQEPNFTVIRVLDRSEGKVIREIPPDEVVRMIERLHDFMGLLIDKKV